MVQARLAVSQPGDPFEVEAERTADLVMRQPSPARPGRPITPMHLTPVRAGYLLPKRCTCGGEAGPGGECAACRTKRLSQSENLAVGRAPPSRAPPHVTAAASQAKLTLNEPGDQYEQEADQVAEQVMRMPDPSIAHRPRFGGQAPGVHIQRMCPACEGGKKHLHAKEVPGQTPAITPAVQAQVNGLRGGGQPLPESVRAFFEPRFGHDFSQVRVHTDAASRETAQALNARAFAAGGDIFFNDQEFQPATHTGRHLLAHELAHTVQQAASRFPDRQPIVQRTIGDGHDLANPRFSGEPRLEAAFDNERVIAVGSCGDHVRIIQEALIDLGVELPIFGADCQFGSETTKAVVSFQTQNGAVIDGVVGFETIGLLDTLAPSGPPPAIECPPCPSKKPPPPPPPDTEEVITDNPFKFDPPKAEDCNKIPGRCNPEQALGPECGFNSLGAQLDCRKIPGLLCGICETEGGNQGKCRDDAIKQQAKEVAKCSDEMAKETFECAVAAVECFVSKDKRACAEAALCAVGGPHFERVECEKEAFEKFEEAQKECDKIVS
jgi:hypothetical protein